MEITFGLDRNSLQKEKRAEKGRSLLKLPSDYIMIDLETTGLDPYWDAIIEISALKVRENQIIETFSTLVKNPNAVVNQFITDLTGITQQMIDSEGISLVEALNKFQSFASDEIVLGYTVNFDINFLYDSIYKELKSHFSNDFVDVMRLARKVLKNERHHRLKDMCKYYNLKKPSHRGKQTAS